MSYEIHLKGGFSERKGLKKLSDKIQINTLDDRTRNLIFNLIIKDFLLDLKKENAYFYSGVLINNFIEFLYLNTFSRSIEDLPNINNQLGVQKLFNDISEIIKKYDFNSVFDLIEAVMKFLKIYTDNKLCPNFEEVNHFSYYTYIKSFNLIFEEENVMYRLIDGKITDITNQQEIDEIQEALKIKTNVCTQHLNKSLELLYDRKNHDYENSIKESISAVESMCNIITGGKDSLGDALKALKKTGVHIHPALEGAFDKLYGYSSNEAGIRHGNGIDMNTTFEEAKFMLVACSAFINYLNALKIK